MGIKMKVSTTAYGAAMKTNAGIFIQLAINFH